MWPIYLHQRHLIRDRSSITGYGGGGGGGGSAKRKGMENEVLPLQKRGDRNSFSHAEGGAQKALR